MSRLIDADALRKCFEVPHELKCGIQAGMDEYALKCIDEQPNIDSVPIQFIHEVIEYLTKCRDYAIHEETKTSWDEQRQTLIMLLHEWDAWNECGRTGKYGEWKEE